MKNYWLDRRQNWPKDDMATLQDLLCKEIMETIDREIIEDLKLQAMAMNPLNQKISAEGIPSKITWMKVQAMAMNPLNQKISAEGIPSKITWMKVPEKDVSPGTLTSEAYEELLVGNEAS